MSSLRVGEDFHLSTLTHMAKKTVNNILLSFKALIHAFFCEGGLRSHPVVTGLVSWGGQRVIVQLKW